MKHAYLIIANRNPRQLQNLLNTIDDSRNDIFLLIDAKSTIIASKFVTRFSNLNVLKPINIYWGSYSQIQAEMNLFESASYGKYGYYHLISGLDLPLVNQDKIHDFFDSHPNHEFLTYSKANGKKQIQLRVKKHFFINQFKNNTEIMNFYRRVEKKVLKVIPVSKRYVDNLGYASNWVTIDHELVTKIIENEEKIYRLFHNGYLVDELFIPTVINFNPEFKTKIYYSIPVTDNPNEFQGNMRFINWWDGTPYTWKIQDYDKLKKARKMGHLFSRKFDDTVDDEIIRLITSDILK